MAEAVAIISFISAISSLADYSTKVVKRLNEFRKNVKELPASFHHISVQLPLLVDIVHRLQEQASQGELALETEDLLKPVVDGLHKEIRKLDGVLGKVLPSADASTWEKGLKAVKSVGAQKDVEEFAAVIRDYVTNLTAFQTTHNSDLIRRLGVFLAEEKAGVQSAVPVSVRKPIWLNKYDSDADFVGRNRTLEDIERQLNEKNHRSALAGIGGVGKSRVAIQYCHHFRQQSPESHIFWVFGGSRSRFETDYQRIAIALDIPGWEDRAVDTLRLVCDWLSDQKNGRWIMVLDGADDHELWLGSSSRERASGKTSLPLIDFLPRCDHGGILVTTRDSQLGHRLVEAKQDPIQIMPFDPEEARILLVAKLSDDKGLSPEDADELTRALEYLPLTITQAAAYLKQIDISASKYLELLRKGEEDIPNLLAESIDDPGRDRETSNSVFHTWKISFDQILKQSPAAADLLSLMAMLDRQAIPQDLLREPQHSLLQFKAAVSKLKAFSLISEEKASSKYSMHRLVQISTQKWLEHQGTVLMWEQAALAAVARLYPTDVEYESWPLIQDLNSHVQVVLTYNITTKACQLARATILHGLAHYYIAQDKDMLAGEMLEESRELRNENLGPEHEHTLLTMSLLSVAYNKLDYSREAYRLQVYLWETTERVFGPSHPLTLKCMSRLAFTYNRTGDHRQAEELQRKTLDIMERELGIENKATMTEMSNLVYTYNKLEKWRRAEDLGLKTLNLRTKVLGPTHPATLTTMASLAWTYRSQSRWEEAMQLEEKTLTHRVEKLGPDHPKTLLTMSILARLHGQRGMWTEALNVQREVVERLRRTLGPDHRDTLRAEQFLAEWESARDKQGLSKPSNSLLAPPGAERRSRSRSLGHTDSYKPSYGRHRSGASLSPHGSQPDCYRIRKRSASSYRKRDQMDWEPSPDLRQK